VYSIKALSITMRCLLIAALTLCVAMNVFGQTYPATWIDKVNVTLNADNSLTKNVSTNGYVAGAASSNILPPKQDGYIEYTFTGVSGQAVVSFTALNNQTTYVNCLYSFYTPTVGKYYIYERSTNVLTLDGLAVGDVLRIARSGSDINYSRNGVIVKTTTLAGNDLIDLRADVAITAGTAPSVTCSFGPRLMARPTIVLPDYGASNGSISVVMEGGTAPYTYKWSTNETGSSISGKPKGIYTLTATDAAGLVFSRNYELANDVSWKNLVTTTINSNNTLTKSTAGAGVFNSGASSTNTLPQGADGWMEFIISDQPTAAIAGFAVTDIDADFDGILYGFYFRIDGVVSIYEGGASSGIASGMARGDVFRIARKDGRIIYTRNGVELRSLDGAATRPQFITDVSLPNPDGPTAQLTLSYERKRLFKPAIVLPTVENAGGSVNLSVEGTYSTPTISWSSTETGASVSNKPRGSYQATVTDAIGSESRIYNLQYPIRWSELQNVRLIDGGLVQKVAASNSFNAGTISGNRLLGNTSGFIETIVPRILGGNRYMFGLTRYNTSPGGGIDYSFQINFPTGVVSIFEGAASTGVSIPFVEGMILKIARDGSNIYYYADGVQVYTHAVPPEYELQVDCSIYAGTVYPITASFDYVTRTFYAIADGNWTTPSIWSLTDGGTAGTQCPTAGDIVFVKGKKVTVTTGVSCKNLNIQATNSNTGVLVDGASAILSVSEEINVKGVNNTDVAQAFKVQNQGQVAVKKY